MIGAECRCIFGKSSQMRLKILYSGFFFVFFCLRRVKIAFHDGTVRTACENLDLFLGRIELIAAETDKRNPFFIQSKRRIKRCRSVLQRGNNFAEARNGCFKRFRFFFLLSIFL